MKVLRATGVVMCLVLLATALRATGPLRAQPPLLESLLVPGIDVDAPAVIYTQPQRVSRGLRYWPDGNLGVVPAGGQTLFFAANSTVAVRTSGTLDDPAFILESKNVPIIGADAAFSYVAGGPVYRDPETGMLLMFYHAERHFGGSGALFYSELGMARSQDGGWSFQDLGIILTPNQPPDPQFARPVEMAGAPFVVRDGYFTVYFRDMLRGGQDVNLAAARAPVDAVLQAARAGTTADWRKYFNGDFAEPGLGGRASPLEIGNPLNRWMSVSDNAALARLVLVVVETVPGNRTRMHLSVSADGLTWSPRVTVQDREGELFYPSIVNPGGDPLQTGSTFYVYYTASENGSDRWRDASLERIAVSPTGELTEADHDWTFDADAEGWFPLNQVGAFEARGGSLVIEPTGGDPYIRSPDLGLSTERYTHIELRMKSERAGTGQFFFTGTAAPGISEENAVRFPVQGGDAFQTTSIDMALVPGWSGHLGYLRFDPIDGQGHVEIDYIRLAP